MFDTPHWTDTVGSVPIFSTVIPGTGSAGNTMTVLGNATNLLRQLRIPNDRIEKLRADVMGAESYEAAIKLIEHWFPVQL